MISLEKISPEGLKNEPLRKLISELKSGSRSEVDLLRRVPDSAQKIPNQWHHHTDHSDYSESKHTDSSSPTHGDYCD